MRAIDGFEIDCEADVIGKGHELNHAAVLQKIGSITDGEDVGVSEDGKIFADAVAFARADKYDGAGFCGTDIGRAIHMDGKIVDGRIGGKEIEGRAHRIASQNTDIERGAPRDHPGEANEFPKVEKVCRLDVIFGGFGRLRGTGDIGEKQEGQKHTGTRERGDASLIANVRLERLAASFCLR